MLSQSLSQLAYFYFYSLSTNRHDVGTQTSISHRTDPRNLSGAAFLHPSSGMSSVRSNEVPADYSLVGDSREESLRTSSDIWRVTNYEGPSGINPLRVSSGQSARTSSEMFRVNSYEDPADNNRLRVSRPGNRRPTRRMWGGNRHYVDPTANNPIGDSGEETGRTTSTMWSETGNENPTGNNHHRSEIYMRRMVGDPEE
jgi:hypothetical protein